MSRYNPLSAAAVRLAPNTVGGIRGGATPAPIVLPGSTAPSDYSTPGPGNTPVPTGPEESFFSKYRKPLMIGGGILAASVLIYVVVKKKGRKVRKKR